MAAGNRVLDHFLPDTHPCKQDIIKLYHDYMMYCTSYLSVPSSRSQRSLNPFLKEAMLSVEDVSGETCLAFQCMRTGLYTVFLSDVFRLLACYRNMLSISERRRLYKETIMRGTVGLGIVEDIRDTQGFHIQLPRRLPVNEYLEHVNNDMINDSLSAEPHHAFLMASPELGRSEFTALDLTRYEKEEFMTTLQQCYWAAKDSLEDAVSKHARLHRLCAMFLKYDIYRYLKERLLPQALEQYVTVYGQARKESNMPNDLVSYSLGPMVCQEEHSRPEHLAT